jgi:arylsulfatase A-like enzyme
MSRENEVSRRQFLERLALGAGAVTAVTMVPSAGGDPPTTLGEQAQAAFDAGAFGVLQTPDPAATDIPNVVSKPNILILMVDQLRLPNYWLNASQALIFDSICPNIANIRKNAVTMANCYVAATACTPSRSAMLTGLYAHQTAMFLTQVRKNEPSLNTGFPTFASALQVINQNYQGNVFWYGKWHVSNYGIQTPTSDTLPAYGFNSSHKPNWPSVYGSPIGTGNEGANGIFTSRGNQTVVFNGATCYGSNYDVDWAASDAGIANSFITDWHGGLLPTSNWCIGVSFVNPHDMSQFPNYFPPPYGIVNANTNAGFPWDCAADFYPASSNYTNTMFSAIPTGWNYENVAYKNLALQPWYENQFTTLYGSISENGPTVSYIDFLNWYYFLISQVDFQIGLVLKEVFPSTYPPQGGAPISNNTAIIFLSDHGDYGGSHGLHGKGGAVYDEAIRVPLFIVLPGQSGAIVRDQMCSLVDFFKLIAEFGNGGPISDWTVPPYNAYIDQAQRESIFNYCYNNTSEQYRLVNLAYTYPPGPTPYILTTTDEFWTPANCNLQAHVVAMRTKSLGDNKDLLNFYTGAKYGIYSTWVLGDAPTVDVTQNQQYEYYDYHYLANRGELGNDYFNTNASAQTILHNMASLLGNSPTHNSTANSGAYGLIATELMKPLQGANMMTAQNEAYNVYNNYLTTVLFPGGCPT